MIVETNMMAMLDHSFSKGDENSKTSYVLAESTNGTKLRMTESVGRVLELDSTGQQLSFIICKH